MIRVSNRDHISASPCITGHVIKVPTCQLAFPTMKSLWRWSWMWDASPAVVPMYCSIRSASALIAGASCNQKWAKKEKKKKRAEDKLLNKAMVACGVIIIVSGHCSGQVMRQMCSERSVKQKKTPYALDNSRLFSWCVCRGIFQMHSEDAWKWINQWGHLGRESQDEKWFNAVVRLTVASQT